MLTLSCSDALFAVNWNFPAGCVRLTAMPRIPNVQRRDLMYIVRSVQEEVPTGFGAYACIGHERDGLHNAVMLPESFSYLGQDDVVYIDPQRKLLRSLFRASSLHNAFLLTEMCNHYCVMCSQPPKEVDDSHISAMVLDAIRLIPPYAKAITLSGGESTLLGERFLQIIEACKRHLPYTALHVLSNGTRFSDKDFADKVARIGHHDLMFGIPVYSDEPQVHNFVVQSGGAWDSTINGIINLKGAGVKVEVRVVLHRYTVPTLRSLASFIATNLLFVDHVAFMGLEATGFAKSNWDDLCIHPKDYQEELVEAVATCTRHGLSVSIYNLPHCWLDHRLFMFSRQSICDWKNDYAPVCSSCAAFAVCGGFFASNLARGAVGELAAFTAESFSALHQ